MLQIRPRRKSKPVQYGFGFCTCFVLVCTALCLFSSSCPKRRVLPSSAGSSHLIICYHVFLSQSLMFVLVLVLVLLCFSYCVNYSLSRNTSVFDISVISFPLLFSLISIFSLAHKLHHVALSLLSMKSFSAGQFCNRHTLAFPFRRIHTEPTILLSMRWNHCFLFPFTLLRNPLSSPTSSCSFTHCCYLDGRLDIVPYSHTNSISTTRC